MDAHFSISPFSPIARRKVLRWAGVVFSAAFSGASALAGNEDSGGAVWTREIFTPHLGEVFSLEADDQIPVPCRLTEVSAETGSAGRSPSERFTTFSLLFTVEGKAPEGRIYRVVHSGLGKLELFLSPVGSAGKMEAVISRKV